MKEYIKFGQVVPCLGKEVSPTILENLDELYYFIRDLESANYNFIGANKSGVVIEFLALTSDTMIIEDKIDVIKNRISELKTESDGNRRAVNMLRDITSKHRTELNEHQYHIKKLLSQLKKVRDTKPEPEGMKQSEEFFLFADMLPAHIKKEIKIYIKKWDNQEEECSASTVDPMK